jgi:hypothetical protein
MKTGFLYFLPGKSAGDKLDLDALGLAHARAPGEPTKAPVTKGPDDGPGLLLVFAGDHAPRYVAADQIVAEVAGRCDIGWGCSTPTSPGRRTSPGSR